MSGKNLRRCRCRCRCRSAVADEAPTPYSLSVLPEDIIKDEILLRLHFKALFKFKCVSKRYASIISAPNFAQTYLQRSYSSQSSLSSSGLLSLSLLLFPFTDPSISLNDYTVEDLTDTISGSTHPGPRSIRLSSFSPPTHHRPHTLLASSNGLLLSFFHHTRSKIALCVSNPLTKQCVQLPRTFTPASISELGFGITTKQDASSGAFLAYKIVFMRWVAPEGLGPHEYANTSLEIFSSDTGSWTAREVSCPQRLFNPLAWRARFAYKGTLHWLNYENLTIVTYDPFDSPDRFGSIPLPKENYRDSCLIYSGDREMLKYCGISHFDWASVYNTLWVWRLMDPDKGEWCLEHTIEVRPLIRENVLLMVAPNPWNRRLICRPFFYSDSGDKNGYVRVSNMQVSNMQVSDIGKGLWMDRKVFSESTWQKTIKRSYSMYPLVPIELCPWSSPFYSQSILS